MVRWVDDGVGYRWPDLEVTPSQMASPGEWLVFRAVWVAVGVVELVDDGSLTGAVHGGLMTKQRTISRVFALVIAASLVIAACGSSTDGDDAGSAPPATDAAEPEPAATDVADSDGEESDGEAPDDDSPELADEAYVVELADGVRIDVPAGERSDVAATVVSGSLGGGDGDVVYDLQPSGAEFDKPLVMTIPNTAETGQLVGVGVVLIDDDGTEQALTPEIDEQSITIEIPHFSRQIVSTRFIDIDFSPESPVSVGQQTTVTPAAPIASGIWDSTSVDPPGSADVVNANEATISCTAAGRVNVVVKARETDGFESDSAFGSVVVTEYWGQRDLECVAAAPEPTTAASVVVTQNHNAADLPADLVSIGARSTVLVAILSTAPVDPAATALLFDANSSGVPDAGDQFLFGPQPLVDGTVVNPIDRGGEYFVVTFGAEQIDDLAGSTVQVIELGEVPGQFNIDDMQVDIVINSVDDPRPVFFDVDFGDPTMPPQVP